MSKKQLVFIAVSVGMLAACGKSAEGGGAESADEAAAKAPGAPGIPWSQKTHEQRADWMVHQVLPKMKAAFQGFDAKGFEDFKCQTCHGKNAREVNFKMPNPEIYALPAENTFVAAMEYDKDTTKFMAETVVPTMAKLLDTHPYDMKTGEGFGCFNCHTKE
jgi:hypothetical protein